MLEAGSETFAGQIPTILKVNSSNSWATSIQQALTGSIEDALRLGCAAIGFTIYPGSDAIFDSMTQIAQMRAEAEAVWLDLDRAVPLGLLVSEILSAALDRDDAATRPMEIAIHRVDTGSMRVEITSEGLADAVPTMGLAARLVPTAPDGPPAPEGLPGAGATATPG